MMRFQPPLIPATLLRRYKRFLADVRLADGSEITVHCPNTGSMKHCVVADSPCWLSDSGNPKRKYRFTWELATATHGGIAGVNTARANALVAEALAEGVIAELIGYPEVRREVKYGAENSRIDFLLSGAGPDCFVEVKSVTLAEADGCGYFPDAVSARGSKHLRELQAMAAAGQRAVLLFCVQHSAIDQVRPADHIDPVYGETLRAAAQAGVEVLAYRAPPSAEAIAITESLPVVL